MLNMLEMIIVLQRLGSKGVGFKEKCKPKGKRLRPGEVAMLVEQSRKGQARSSSGSDEFSEGHKCPKKYTRRTGCISVLEMQRGRTWSFSSIDASYSEIEAMILL